MESVSMLRMLPIAFLIVLSSMNFFGCFQATEEKGVLNQWRDNSLPPIEKGKTTETQILELLGPPSQVMNLGDQVIFYYMMEKTEGKGGFLLIYNWNTKKVKYDRAIFFFDKNRILKDYALSKENIEYEKSP
jgi:outer membrane protein assembly factor BamE (lipoprotein component of BamABCDE complex)